MHRIACYNQLSEPWVQNTDSCNMFVSDTVDQGARGPPYEFKSGSDGASTQNSIPDTHMVNFELSKILAKFLGF